MIIGSGDVARALNDREGAIFFASGVSDSQCVTEESFKRESDLLIHVFHTLYKPGMCLFYFSSISVSYTFNRYHSHKFYMEKLVKGMFLDYKIIRLGNITWGRNPNTFLNNLRNKKDSGLPFEIRDEWKYMVDHEQLTLVTDSVSLRGKHTLSIFGEMRKVKDLI